MPPTHDPKELIRAPCRGVGRGVENPSLRASQSDGKTVRHRVRAAGYRGARALAENIAKGPFTPDEVVRRWLNSPGHRRNILRRGAVETGFGVAFGENANGFEVVWVQVFSGR